MLGVCLVVHGDRGHQLAFRYPVEETQQMPRRSVNHLVSQHAYDLATVIIKKQAAPVRKDLIYGIPRSEFARLFTVENTQCGKPLQLTIGDYGFVGVPVLLPTTSQHEITFFHCVFVLDPQLSQTQLDQYILIARQLAKALTYEQERCDFISREVQKMTNIRDEFLRENPTADPKNIINSILNVSTLAACLKDLRNSLCREGECKLLLNNWLHLHFTLNQPDVRTQRPIRPYHTLLLLVKPAELLDVLPGDANPLLRRFIRAVEPRRSFEDIAMALNIPVNAIYRHAAHLVYWGKARIIEIIARHNVYVVSHKATLPLADLARDFQKVFPRSQVTLPEFLSRFSVQKPLGSHIERSSQYSSGNNRSVELIAMLIWSLKKNIISQIHRYIYFLPPESEEDYPQPRLEQSPGLEERKDSVHSVSRRAAKLLPHERRFLESPLSKGPHQRLLRRLCPLFRGEHTLEEILWRESVTTADIEKLFEAYPQFLLSVWHEAPEPEIT